MTTSARWLAEPFVTRNDGTEFSNTGAFIGIRLPLGPGRNIFASKVSFNPLVISLVIQDDLLNEDLGDIKVLEIKCVTNNGSSSVNYRKLLVIYMPQIGGDLISLL